MQEIDNWIQTETHWIDNLAFKDADMASQVVLPMTRSDELLPKLLKHLSDVNRELWLVLSLFAISGVLNLAVSSHRMMLGFYTLPTVFAAYCFGRRHATLTAVASVLLVILIVYFNPAVLSGNHALVPQLGGMDRWFDIALWAGTLVVTAYAMGTLHEREKHRSTELRQTYNGVLMILQQFISSDKYTQNHSYRVSIYATKIAAEMGLDIERIEDVRAASLLHDIGKLEISRDLLYKAAKLTPEEYAEIRTHVAKGVKILTPVGGSLKRVLPIILCHHDRFDGSGYSPRKGTEIPLEARIIGIADTYDAMTSDRPYRKAITPHEARDALVQMSGKDFDPDVVNALVSAIRKNQFEVGDVIV